MADWDADDERGEELNTLQSIYPEIVVDSRHSFAITLDLDVVPARPFPVTFDADPSIHHLSCLPPIHLEITLQDGYPTECPPLLKLTASWLSPSILEKLERDGIALWEASEGMLMLFGYISDLQEAAETVFGLTEPSTFSSQLRPLLLDYDAQQTRDKFNRETFECEVCLEPKKGTVCYRMKNCGHVFCVSCLQEGFNNSIKEGDIDNIKCMSMDCGKSGKKKDRILSPNELLQIPLAVDVVKRFANLKRKKRIEKDKSIVYCPRQWCQAPERSSKYPKIDDITQIEEWESEDEVEDAAPPAPDDGPKGAMNIDRLAICEGCNLAFCRLCLASWHGDRQWCQSREANELTKDDQESLNFISQNTTPCPTCSVPAIKSYGCNHMTCFQCKTHFCYLCGSWLQPGNPYQHFNEPKRRACYRRLMDLATGEDVQFGGRRGAEQQAAFWEEEAMRIQAEELDEGSER
ncbi:RING finger protein-like protein [Polyplosphaeria fusca]|uniref:RBR-type E3 ubiquitin transferase n=1 Tax=Polyplosphaeria fusca TaxID=682080 RepID=A0A9P4UTZ8_9PLEO|nr:RING finger protein-like protein [Polyplosphaeria fusca]